MLLTHPFFQSFIPSKTIAPSTSAEVINGLHLTSKEEVDMLLDKALTAGAHESRERYDYGFMYGRTFEDLDGHIWEVFRMDPSQMPQD
ncbi:MAG: hypothetical protein H6765_04700 [Candidatus Peribacteria bacterium]|nr:MAG: hypothetical protein H6765_04700 [Candidatus Peribacteria bacterium]